MTPAERERHDWIADLLSRSGAMIAGIVSAPTMEFKVVNGKLMQRWETARCEEWSVTPNYDYADWRPVREEKA